MNIVNSLFLLGIEHVIIEVLFLVRTVAPRVGGWCGGDGMVEESR